MPTFLFFYALANQHVLIGLYEKKRKIERRVNLLRSKTVKHTRYVLIAFILRINLGQQCMAVQEREKNQKLLELLRSKLGSQLIEAKLDKDDVVLKVSAEHIYDFLKILKLDAELRFSLFLSVTVIDWMDKRAQRFEVVYHLLSLENNLRVRIKSDLSEEKPEIASVVSLWSGANFMEREAFDMYGIKFLGHPELKRILMYDEFVGYPLRKDYPVQAKQPRIPLRYPEVHNTARDMHRPELVQIGKSTGKPALELQQGKRAST